MNELKSQDYPYVNQVNDDLKIGIVKDIFASVTDKYQYLSGCECGRRGFCPGNA